MTFLTNSYRTIVSIGKSNRKRNVKLKREIEKKKKKKKKNKKTVKKPKGRKSAFPLNAIKPIIFVYG